MASLKNMASPKAKEPSPPLEEEKAREEKKARAAKSASPSHPPYFQMIKEAIMALKERGGSSSRVIAKHVEGNYNSALPAHFRKMLKLQLKNCVAGGRFLKIKGSYKLFRHEQKLAEVKKLAAVSRGKKPEASDAAICKHKGKASARQKNKVPATGSNLPAAAEAKPAKSTEAEAKKAKKVAPAKSNKLKTTKSPVDKKASEATAA